MLSGCSIVPSHKEHVCVAPLPLQVGKCCSLSGCSYSVLRWSVCPVYKLTRIWPEWCCVALDQLFKACHHHLGESDWLVVVERCDVSSVVTVEDFRQGGSADRASRRLKILVQIPASWSAQPQQRKSGFAIRSSCLPWVHGPQCASHLVSCGGEAAVGRFTNNCQTLLHDYTFLKQKLSYSPDCQFWK